MHDAFKDVKHVYHCAATVSFDPKDDALLFKVNIEGTANVFHYRYDWRDMKFPFFFDVEQKKLSATILGGNLT